MYMYMYMYIYIYIYTYTYICNVYCPLIEIGQAAPCRAI